MSSNPDLSTRLLDSEASLSQTAATSYNPLLFPPDVEKARIHGRASRAKKYKGDSEDPKGEICECCERPVEAEPLGFNCTIQDLYQYRYCAPLFFQFAQYCIKILAVLLISFGAYCMFMNSRGSYVGDHSSAFGNRFSVLQILNQNEEWDSLYVQTFMMAVGAILLLIMRHRLRNAQKQVVWECNKEINSPSEYALRLIGLKGVEITEEEVREYILENTEVKDPDAIKKVIFVYDIHELTDLHRQRLKFMNSRVKVQEDAEKIEGFEKDKEFQALDKEGKIEELSKRLEEIEEKIIEIENERRGGDDYSAFYFTGTVIIIFDEHEDVKAIKKKWKMTWFSWLMIRILGCFCCYGSYKLKGRVVKMIEIPEPSDIMWENFNYSTGWKLCQIIKANSMTLFVTIIAAATQLGISFFKHNKAPGLFLTLLSYAGSLVVVVVNQMLVKIIRVAATSEKHISHTKFHRSVAEKLTIAQFMNSTAIPIAVNFLTHYLKDDAKTSVLDGLAYDMYFIFLTNAITTPLLLFFDPTFTARAYHQSNLENDPKYSCMTQAEANELFEYPPFDASAKYSAYIKTMWMTALFAPLIPVVIAISLVGLTLRYWLDKFLLIRRNSAPKMMGKKLSMRMLKYLELTPFWFGLGSLLINVYSREYYHELSFGIVICLVVMLVSLVHLFVPTNKIGKKLRKAQKRKSKTVSYSEAQLAFSTDYDRSYPLTQAKAEETRLEEYIKTVTDPKTISQLQTMLENLRVMRQNRKPLDSSLANYVVQNADLQDAYKGNIYGCHAGRKEDHFYQNNAAPVFEINVQHFQGEEGGEGQNESFVMPQSRVRIAHKENKKESREESSSSKTLFPDMNTGGRYPQFENQGIIITSQQPQGFIYHGPQNGNDGHVVL